MSDTLIQLNDVSKNYRIYLKPSYKILGALSLPVPQRGIQEFCSLLNINLSVKKGARLGIVGRNGAGKSTLLKIISGQIKPSSGTVSVRGEVQALMELGTGFHPDFSGWENIISALGYMGVTGKKAEEEARKITEFAELEEFIQNPLKTYSTGMSARLSFTVATTIKPEILIIDEILGAGDAYFSQKAYDRMKRLTSNGTTVLFVSHDMSAVQQLCDEAIWIERGSIVMRDDTSTVAKAYADMIRKREFLRLQAHNSMMKVTTLENIRKNTHKLLQFIFRLCGNSAKVSVSRVSLLMNECLYTWVEVGGAQDSALSEPAFVLLDTEASNWGKAVFDKKDRYCRTVKVNDAQAATVVFNLDGVSYTDKVTLEIEYKGASVQLQFYDGANYTFVATLPKQEEWGVYQCDVSSEAIAGLLTSLGYIVSDEREVSQNRPLDPVGKGVDGVVKSEIFTGHIEIENVMICDKHHVECYQFNSFDALWIKIKYCVMQDVYKPEFVVTVHYNGIIVFQTLSRNQKDSPDYLAAGMRAEAMLHIPELTLGRGTYLISIGIFPEIDRGSLDTEKTALILQDRRYEISVSQPEGGSIDLGIARSHCHWNFKHEPTVVHSVEG